LDKTQLSRLSASKGAEGSNLLPSAIQSRVQRTSARFAHPQIFSVAEGWTGATLRIGFTLAELAEVLKARDAGRAPCRRVYQLAQDKLNGIEADIEALKRTRRYVKKVLCDWEQRIESAGSGEKSHLLYSLTDAVKKAGTPVDQFRRKTLT